jgi:hypothetical protein
MASTTVSTRTAQPGVVPSTMISRSKAEALRATHTIDEKPRSASSRDALDRPTYKELLEFWEAQ